MRSRRGHKDPGCPRARRGNWPAGTAPPSSGIEPTTCRHRRTGRRRRGSKGSASPSSRTRSPAAAGPRTRGLSCFRACSPQNSRCGTRGRLEGRYVLDHPERKCVVSFHERGEVCASGDVFRGIPRRQRPPPHHIRSRTWPSSVMSYP